MNFRRKNGGIIRPKGIFSKHFGIIHLADLGVLKHFSKKKLYLSSSFLFSLSLSSSSCLFSCLASSLFLSSLCSSLVFHLLSSLLFSSLLLSFIFSLLSSLFSLLSSLLFSSLLLSRLSSFIFSCLLVLFHLLLSSLVLSLFRCLSFSVFFLCLLSLSPCCVVWCVSLWSWCCWCLVCVCFGTVKKREKNLCGFKNASVCTFKTSPVYAGNTRTRVSTCARGAGIHGDVLNGHTEGRAVSSSVLLTKICPRRGGPTHLFL